MARLPMREALEANQGSVMALPGVVGIGIGEQNGQPCFRVMVDAAAMTPGATIPAEIGGYPVVVDYTGPIRALGEE